MALEEVSEHSVDKPTKAGAASIHDLKQRGMLDETLVVWGGEFGRTPMVEASAVFGRSQGRDHHPQTFTMRFAGAALKAAFQMGATDELGFHVVDQPGPCPRRVATILHCLSINHSRLSFRFCGLDFCLRGMENHQPVKAFLA
ncbi:MAG: hypothetical protein M2R45_00856 [Verrucomicrobia subdivision 3 bacterium]|nr:hypothetical protein [Limisphaerales bacterium]MCS1413038.1 hypothetical protein [Limisphaerales bacterium]